MNLPNLLPDLFDKSELIQWLASFDPDLLKAVNEDQDLNKLAFDVAAVLTRRGAAHTSEMWQSLVRQVPRKAKQIRNEAARYGVTISQENQDQQSQVAAPLPDYTDTPDFPDGMLSVKVGRHFETFMSVAWWLGCAIGAALPAIAYVANMHPPLLGPAHLLLSPASLAAMWLSFRSASPDLHTRTASVWRLLLASAASISLYALALHATTVPVPPEFGMEREQIGFRLWETGLTDYANAILKEKPHINAEDLMLRGGGFSTGATTLWHPTHIYAAGIVCIGLFWTTWLTWGSAMGLVAADASRWQRRDPAASAHGSP